MSSFDPSGLLDRLASFGAVERCWIAFSGGLDSTALLAAASDVRARLPGELHAVHIDHGLSPASGRWAEHCAAFCSSRAIPMVTRRLRLERRCGESLEAIARDARYAVFRELLGRGDLLLTAHHRDDQAETLMLALLRGSGVRGLAAMPFEARLGRGRLVRPLLEHGRDALRQYALRAGLDWLEDPSNQQIELDRNFLRQRVMPVLRERWASASKTLSRSARHCAEAAYLVDGIAVQTLPQLFGDCPGTLSIALLDQLERPLQKAILRAWIESHGFSRPDTVHAERILDEVMPARTDASPLVRWLGCEVRRYRGDLFCLAPLPSAPARTLRLPWVLGDAASSRGLPDGLGVLHWSPEGAGAGSALELDVCFGQAGLSCRPRGSPHHRPLKKLFQEQGVPPWLRPYVPMLIGGDGLIAIPGLCGCGEAGAGLHGMVTWTGAPGGPVAQRLQAATAVGMRPQ